ncbi:MAG: hypothetical protein ACSHX0_08355 [Akkermansiaceae bacterium]
MKIIIISVCSLIVVSAIFSLLGPNSSFANKKSSIARSTGRTPKVNRTVEYQTKEAFNALIRSLSESYIENEGIPVYHKGDLSYIPEVLTAFFTCNESVNSYEEAKSVSRLLLLWYKKSPMEVLDWLPFVRDQFLRLDYFELLMVSTIESEGYSVAIARALQYLPAKEGRIHIPRYFFHYAIEESPEEIFQLWVYNRKQTEGDGMGIQTNRWGFDFEYPVDFPFLEMMDRLSSYEAKLKTTGEHIDSYPSNMMRVWARREPQAALDWLNSGKELLGNDSFSEFIVGYASVASATELGLFLAEGFSADKTDFRRLSSALVEMPDPEFYRAFINNVDQTEETGFYHVKTLSNLLLNSKVKLSTRLAVLVNIPKEQHFEVFSHEELKFVTTGRYRETFIETLTEVGHSLESVELQFPITE